MSSLAVAAGPSGGRDPGSDGARRDYHHLWRLTLLRLLLTYLAPLLMLTAYFHLQYRHMARESHRRHLLSIADNQAATLDLFLRERLANLTNLIDDPRLQTRPSQRTTEDFLARLRRDSSTFVDLGFFDASGTMLSYAGPFPTLLERSYGDEAWFVTLLAGERRYVVTDMYLGFRGRPHFTIAVRRGLVDGPVAVRATLDPERFYEYITTLRGSGEVHSLLVNVDGRYQMVDVRGTISDETPELLPPREPVLGVGATRLGAASLDYAYCWLELTDWALMVLGSATGGSQVGGFSLSLVAISAAVILAVSSTIVIRAGQVVRHQRAEDTVRRELSGQLQHAARLASVGELSAVVAHYINNPLAIIAEESGLLQDLISPDFSDQLDRQELDEHLAAISEAAFRARDITRKLLSFVRRADVVPSLLDLNEVVEDAIAGLLEREMTVANIEVVRDFAADLPPVLADGGQIEQVLVNLVTNAIDAMPTGGRLILSTAVDGPTVRVGVVDTGVGIAAAQMEKIFMPFHTTKEVGKGTGLGLSVSYSIVKGHGGDIQVESSPGSGSTFTVVLPVHRTCESEV
jgi:two-component system NtrC family sensor kinase